MTSRTLVLTLLMLSLCAAPGISMSADSWAGRKLSSVLAELRAAGLPLLYSSQIVSEDLTITSVAGGVLQLERLRSGLDDRGPALKELEPGQGYAGVRSDHPRHSKTAAAIAAMPGLDQ